MSSEHGGTEGSGLDDNVAGALAYLFGAITGVVFLLIDNDRPFVRFHAAQSIVLSVLVVAVYFVVGVLSSIIAGLLLFSGFAFAVVSILNLFWSVFSLLVFVGWLYLMWTAYQGNTVRIPRIAEFADQLT